ncbi:10534_t:CDS:2 [Paraglomus occultum]|uniref:10534_t:CDS:1 n=1 Tax=Paraglomus occultum TaxID=144539 RepID=A0A9N8WKQ8_9GLOM|nr:10534_t:CDS:2 [Paraglomus occultum]
MPQTSIPTLTPTSSGTDQLSSLTPDKLKLLSQFRSNLPNLLSSQKLSPSESTLKPITTDIALYCYLQGNRWSLAEAEKQWLKTVAWRIAYKTSEISHEDEDVSKCARFRTNYVNGFDKFGRPLIYLKKRADKHEKHDFAAGLRLLVHSLETALKVMPSTAHQLVIIMDFTLFHQSHSVPLPVARETLTILSTHYPERLARAYLVNAPFLLRCFLKLLSPFMDEVTRNKIVFVDNVPTEANMQDGAETKNGKSKIDPILAEWIDESMLEVAYGGNLNFVYEHDIYWSFAEENGIKAW